MGELGATTTDLVILVFSASVAAFISTASFSAIAVKIIEKQLKVVFSVLQNHDPVLADVDVLRV